MKVEVGKTYNVKHVRKGNFTIRVTAINGEWIDGVIVAGRVRYASQAHSNEGYVGDAVTVRACLATFEETTANEADAPTYPA